MEKRDGRDTVSARAVLQGVRHRQPLALLPRAVGAKKKEEKREARCPAETLGDSLDTGWSARATADCALVHARKESARGKGGEEMFVSARGAAERQIFRARCYNDRHRTPPPKAIDHV